MKPVFLDRLKLCWSPSTILGNFVSTSKPRGQNTAVQICIRGKSSKGFSSCRRGFQEHPSRLFAAMIKSWREIHALDVSDTINVLRSHIGSEPGAATGSIPLPRAAVPRVGMGHIRP